MLPIISTFFEMPKLTLWELLNSQVLSTGIGTVEAILVAKYGSKTAAAVTDAAVAQEASNASRKAEQLETQENADAVGSDTRHDQVKNAVAGQVPHRHGTGLASDGISAVQPERAIAIAE